MKRISVLVLAFVLLSAISACAGENRPAQNSEGQAEIVTEGSSEAETASAQQADPTVENSSEAETASAQQTDILTEDSSEAETDSAHQEEDIKLIYADTGKGILEIEPADNTSAEAFMSLLEAGDVTVDLHDYGNFEKVGPLGRSFPTNDERITTEPGDVILYQGDQISIYYDTNTWEFTRLGKVRNLSQEELKESLGEGDVTVVFSLR